MSNPIRSIDTEDLVKLQGLSSEYDDAERNFVKAKGRLEFHQRVLSQKYSAGKPIIGISPETGEILEASPDAVVPVAQVPAT